MCSLEPYRIVLHSVSIAPPGLDVNGTNSEAVLTAYLVLLARSYVTYLGARNYVAVLLIGQNGTDASLSRNKRE
jgi:hypothetical protein